MKIKDIAIILLALVVIVLVLVRGCGHPQSDPDRTDITLIYDSLERVIISNIPEQEPDTIRAPAEIRWMAQKRDTIWRDSVRFELVEAAVDTDAIILHWQGDALTYSDTLRDTALVAIVEDTVYQNKIIGRGFEYKLLGPQTVVSNTYKPDRFQFHVLFAAATATDLDSIYKPRLGGGFILEFRSGTSLGFKYDHTIGHRVPHGLELMVTQRLRFKKPTTLKAIESIKTGL